MPPRDTAGEVPPERSWYGPTMVARVAACLCLFLWVFPAAARAQDDTEAAKIHYKSGEQYYLRGLYPQAIGEFKEAYRLSKAAALLYNMSQAYERMGDLPSARDYLKRYMDSGGTDPGELPTLREKLANLDARIAQPKTEPKPPPPPAPKPEQPPPAPAPTEQGGDHPLRAWKWITGGAGVASVVVALAFGADGKAQQDKLDQHKGEPYTKELNDIYLRGQRDNKLAAGFGVVGGALVVTSVVFFFLDARSEKPAAVTIAPAIGPGLAGAAAVWRF
jgi:tetratricopeptide (TPR) repeat protein